MAKPGTKPKDTIDALKERMSRDPFSRAFLQLAEGYRKAGRYDDAVRVCQEGLARHPTYHTARIALGRTYLEKGDLESARRALSEVLELAPENHLAAKLLAEVQRRMGDLHGAAATYRAILRHYPGDREIEALLRDLQEPRADESPAGAPSPGPTPPAPAAAPRAGPVPSGATGAEPSFDYHPEDIVPAATAVSPLVPTGSAPPRPPERAPDPGGASEGEGEGEEVEPDALKTNTLAELYLRQGLVDRALEVYGAMLRLDPGNERVRRRLMELEPARPPIPPPVAGPRVGARSAEAVASPAATFGPAAAPSESRLAIGRLERWLQAVRSGAQREGAGKGR